MDHFHAIRDLGIEDPAADRTGEDAARAALMQEIEQAAATVTATSRPRRRRRPRVQLRVAIPALAGVAAAATAAIVVVGTGTGTGTGSRSAARTTPTASVHGQDTAFIVRRAQAALAASGDVDVWTQAGGDGDPGSDTTSTTRSYTDPRSGVFHQSSVLTEPDGTEVYARYTVGTPVGDHRMRFQATAVAPQQHLYAVTTSVGSPFGSTAATAATAQVKQQLAGGQATEAGTAVVDGQTTIKLVFPTTGGRSLILYVNAKTDAPVQSVSASPATAVTPSDTANIDTTAWQPANATGVAQTDLGQATTGDTQVSLPALEQADRAGR